MILVPASPLGNEWSVVIDSPGFSAMLVAWATGFVVYQLVNPGAIPHWSDFWTTIGTALHTLGHPWLSASLAAFAVALLVALPFARPLSPHHHQLRSARKTATPPPSESTLLAETGRRR